MSSYDRALINDIDGSKEKLPQINMHVQIIIISK